MKNANVVIDLRVNFKKIIKEKYWGGMIHGLVGKPKLSSYVQ